MGNITVSIKCNSSDNTEYHSMSHCNGATVSNNIIQKTHNTYSDAQLKFRPQTIRKYNNSIAFSQKLQGKLQVNVY